MDFQNPLYLAIIRNHDDVGFLPDTDLVANGIDAFILLVRVESEVVVSSVGQSVAVILIPSSLSVFLLFHILTNSNQP